MSEQPATPRGAEESRCPSCGARVVPEQDWCSLCLQPLGVPAPAHGTHPGPDAPHDPADPYAGLPPGHLHGPAHEGTHPGADVEPGVEPDAQPGVEGDVDGHALDPDVLAAEPLDDGTDRTPGPRHGVGGPAQTLPPGVAEAMLAELAVSTAAERPGAGGPLAGTSRGVRVALGCGAALVLVGILVALVSLVGLLL